MLVTIQLGSSAYIVLKLLPFLWLHPFCRLCMLNFKIIQNSCSPFHWSFLAVNLSSRPRMSLFTPLASSIRCFKSHLFAVEAEITQSFTSCTGSSWLRIYERCISLPSHFIVISGMYVHCLNWQSDQKTWQQKSLHERRSAFSALLTQNAFLSPFFFSA